MVAFSSGYDLTNNTWAVLTTKAMQIKLTILLKISISLHFSTQGQYPLLVLWTNSQLSPCKWKQTTLLFGQSRAFIKGNASINLMSEKRQFNLTKHWRNKGCSLNKCSSLSPGNILCHHSLQRKDVAKMKHCLTSNNLGYRSNPLELLPVSHL